MVCLYILYQITSYILTIFKVRPLLWTMKDTHLYFLSKYKQDSLKCYIYYALTFQRLNIIFKMQVTFICLKGSNFTTYYLPLTWRDWKNAILFIKSKKERNCEKRSGGSTVNDICFNKIMFLKLLPSCKSVNPLQRS